MLTRVDTEEFTIYTQTVTEHDNDEYMRLKWIRERNKLGEWFNKVLQDREVIVSWAEGKDMYSVTATLKTQGYNNLVPLPMLPTMVDEINGKFVDGITHVHFYARPEMMPVMLELDHVVNMIVRREGLDAILNK